MAAANAVISLVALTLFVGLFYGPWQAVCTDWARQILFEKRDKLFDIAMEGKLDFASEEYKSIRRSFESMIRFAHDLTWPKLLFFRKMHRESDMTRPPLFEMIGRIQDKAVRQEVRDLVLQSTQWLIFMMALKSMLGVAIALVMWFSVMCSSGFKYIVRRNSIVQTLSETILTEAQFT
jgi:hypothetical protein